MAYVTTLLIIFDDYTEKEIIEVNQFGVDEKGYWFVKNGYKSFFNKDKVVYFGRAFDYNEEKSDERY